jgi:predicted transcriptional regulator
MQEYAQIQNEESDMARQVYVLRVRDTFRESIAALGITMERFAEEAGMPRITLVKALQRGTVRPLTAQKVARAYSQLAQIAPGDALERLFEKPQTTTQDDEKPAPKSE